jgi:hypothetical protein
METTTATTTTTAIYWVSEPIGIPGADGIPGVPGLPGPVGIIEETSGSGVRCLYDIMIFNKCFTAYYHLSRLLKLLKNIVMKIFEL